MRLKLTLLFKPQTKQLLLGASKECGKSIWSGSNAPISAHETHQLWTKIGGEEGVFKPTTESKSLTTTIPSCEFSLLELWCKPSGEIITGRVFDKQAELVGLKKDALLTLLNVTEEHAGLVLKSEPSNVSSKLP